MSHKIVELQQAWTGIADCMNCTIRQSVLFAGLEEEDFAELHRPIGQRVYRPGERIYSMNDEARSLFTIRSGLVKLVQYLPNGTGRIVRMLKKTDVLGLELMLEDAYEHDAYALHRTEVCILPVDDLKRLSRHKPELYHVLMARWHKALSNSDRWVRDFSTGSAKQRVARLLLCLTEYEGGSECQLFGREDLGAILGLTTETASRTMAELKRQGLVAEVEPNVFNCNLPNLTRIAEN